MSPYSYPNNIPERIKDLPEAAQKMWIKVFNSAFEQYNDDGKASATAWSAVKKKYTKRDSKWVSLSEGSYKTTYCEPHIKYKRFK